MNSRTWLALVLLCGLSNSGLAWQNQDAPEKGDAGTNPHDEDEENKDKRAGGGTTEGDPVDPATGAFQYSRQVLRISGRGMDVDLSLFYLSSAWGIRTNTGARWSHDFEERLVIQYSFPVPPKRYHGPVGELGKQSAGESAPDPESPPNYKPIQIDVFHYHDLRIDSYRRDPTDPNNWIGEAGNFCKLRSENTQQGPYAFPLSFTLRDSAGRKTYFPNSLEEGGCHVYTLRPERIEDRAGNLITFTYSTLPTGTQCPGNQGTFYRRLSAVTDTLGRNVSFAYDSNGWLETITDFTGRQVRLEHDSIGNVMAIQEPTVTVFPTTYMGGPQTARTEFLYTPRITGMPDSGHNIAKTFAPTEVLAGQSDPSQRKPYVENLWNESLIGDRVRRQILGGTNASGVPAGGIYDFIFYDTQQYIEPPFFVDHGWFHEISQMLVVDPNGYARLYFIDKELGTPLVYRFTGTLDHASLYPNTPQVPTLVSVSPGTPQQPNTASSADHLVGAGPSVGSQDPAVGCRFERQWYNSEGLIVAEEADGYRTEYVYDSTSPDRFQQMNQLVSHRFPIGTPADRITTAHLYEPLFNSVRAVYDPRSFGGYTAPNGSSSSVARYSTGLSRVSSDLRCGREEVSDVACVSA